MQAKHLDHFKLPTFPGQYSNGRTGKYELSEQDPGLLARLTAGKSVEDWKIERLENFAFYSQAVISMSSYKAKIEKFAWDPCLLKTRITSLAYFLGCFPLGFFDDRIQIKRRPESRHTANKQTYKKDKKTIIFILTLNSLEEHPRHKARRHG